jgi:hypothetical protein
MSKSISCLLLVIGFGMGIYALAARHVGSTHRAGSQVVHVAVPPRPLPASVTSPAPLDKLKSAAIAARTGGKGDSIPEIAQSATATATAVRAVSPPHIIAIAKQQAGKKPDHQPLETLPPVTQTAASRDVLSAPVDNRTPAAPGPRVEEAAPDHPSFEPPAAVGARPHKPGSVRTERKPERPFDRQQFWAGVTAAGQ